VTQFLMDKFHELSIRKDECEQLAKEARERADAAKSPLEVSRWRNRQDVYLARARKHAAAMKRPGGI
jgi:hypothetical protein